MTHTYTWRCTACPRPRVTVETTEDAPPVCPTCGKVMKTTDCCGVSGAQKNPQHDPKRCGCGVCIRRRSNPEPMPEGDYEGEQFTHVGGRRVSLGRPFEQTLDAAFGRHVYYRPMGVAVQDQLNMPAEIVDAPVFITTNLERRLDVTERLVHELTERLYPVVQGDVETEVLSDCSPLGERVERLNGLLGRLLGGLDLP